MKMVKKQLNYSPDKVSVHKQLH